MYRPGQPYAPVNALVWNKHWGKHYTVLSHNRNGSVTVQWEGGDVVSHRTPFMPGRDRIVVQSEHVHNPQVIAAMHAVHAASQVTA